MSVLSPKDSVLRKANITLEAFGIGKSNRNENQNLLLDLLASLASKKLVKALGIKGRNLVELETTMIQKWTEGYAFSLDIVEEACARTISATHQPSFEYTDRILTNWHSAGVKSMDDIQKLDESYQQNKKVSVSKEKQVANNKFNNFVQRSYDYDQLEKKLLSRNQN